MWFSASTRTLWRITGVRVALGCTVAALVGALLVFGIVHHATEASWRDQIDERVAAAQADILGDLQQDHNGLTWNVQVTLAEGSGLFYAALAPDGRWLAGNFHLSPEVADRWTHPKTLKQQPGLALPRHVLAIRGTSLRLPDGERLFIAADASALLTLKSLIARSFMWVFGTILALGLVISLLVGGMTLRRVDQFARTLHEIMEGDLTRRLDIRKNNDEFDRLAAEVNQTLQRICELMKNLQQVTNDISHDLRQPLARLRVHLDLARRRFEDPVLDKIFEEGIDQLDKALSIFSAMLQIAEIEARSRHANFHAVDLSTLLEMLAESYEPIFAEQNILLTTDIAPDLWLQGDRELLAQAIVNLLDNILLHAQGASRASIHASMQAQWLVIQLTDDGIGIPPDAREQVWRRFARLDASRHRPGFGLGLSLVQAIVALHGGEAVFEDIARGTLLRMRFSGDCRNRKFRRDDTTC